MKPTFAHLMLLGLAVHLRSVVSEESDCGLSALQVEKQQRSTSDVTRADATMHDESCEGPWCTVLTSFCRLFDSNKPWQMQKAMNTYSEYARFDQGIKVAVTKDHFYEMYHGNVGRKLSEYLPQRLFSWEFNDDFETMKSGSAEARIARSG